MKRIATLIGCGLLAGCAAPASSPTPATRSSDSALEWVVGHVRVVGSLPVDVQTVITPASGRSVEVRGPLRDEIRRLSGAEVAVFGVRTGEIIQVSDYQLRAVDGSPAFLGEVERADDGGLVLRTDRGEVLRIGNADESVRPGQKAWVQGPATVEIRSYGVVRP